jgi:hypothetical protein
MSGSGGSRGRGAAASAMSNLAFGIGSAAAFIFLSRTLRLTPPAVGLVVAAGSITVMAGAALTPRLVGRPTVASVACEAVDA